MADDTIALFCAYLQRRNYSPHTVDNYGRDLRLFFAQVAKAPGTVSGRDVTVFIEHQRAAQRTATTINRRLNAVQHFFEYLATDRQTLGSNPVKPSHFLRRGRPLPRACPQSRCVVCSPRSRTRSTMPCIYSSCAVACASVKSRA